MQPNKTEQTYSKGPNGTGWLTFRDRQIDPGLIAERKHRAEMEQRRKGFLRQYSHDRTWANYHPAHRAARG